MNDYLNNGKYSLIVRYLDDNTIEKVSFDGRTNIDIAYIDLLTMSCSDINQFIDYLLANNKIKNANVDLFIAKKYKKNETYKIKYEDLIFGLDFTSVDFLSSLAKKRLQNEEVNLIETKHNSYISRFLYKAITNNSFFQFVKSYKSYVDINTINKIRETEFFGLRNESNFAFKYSDQAKKVSQRIKFELANYNNEYTKLRNIVLNNIIFSKLNEKYKENITYILKDFESKREVEQIERKSAEEFLLRKLDKNYIEGQINMTDINFNLDHIDEIKDESAFRINNEQIVNEKSDSLINSEEPSYSEKLERMYKEETMIKNSPYDDPYLQKLFIEGGVERVISLGREFLKKSTLEDKFRASYIDYLEYKNCKRKEKNK